MDPGSLAQIEHEWLTDRVNVAWGDQITQIRYGCLFLGCYPASTENDDVTIAAKCGALVHEMGHLIEIDDRRATAENFGLRYKRTVILSPTRYSSGIYPDPRTCQGVLRECRVIAIQSRILTSAGWTPEEVVEDTLGTIRALNILPDWGYTPGKNEDAQRAWCLRKVQHAHRQWPIERVRAEWWRKVVLITKRLQRQSRG